MIQNIIPDKTRIGQDSAKQAANISEISITTSLTALEPIFFADGDKATGKWQAGKLISETDTTGQADNQQQ